MRETSMYKAYSKPRGQCADHSTVVDDLDMCQRDPIGRKSDKSCYLLQCQYAAQNLNYVIISFDKKKGLFEEMNFADTNRASRTNKTSSRRGSDTSSLQAPYVEKASSYSSKLDHSSLLSYGAERYYADERTFLAALKLFNIKLELGQVYNKRHPQRWEYKGRVQVSFRMCVLCKDLGKEKHSRDRYYLDVLEVRQCRTILCRSCLEYFLYKDVGNCLEDIEKKLREMDTSV